MARAIPFVIRRMTPQEAPQVATLHAQVFPDYFLTRLGQGGLRILYSELATNSRAWSFVAVCDSQLVGFVAGVAEWNRVKKEMALRRWPEALTAVAPQLVRNPSLLVPLAQRLVPSVKLRSPQRDSATAFVRSLPQPDYPCYLLTIGVAPPAQGTPVAADLTHALLDQLRSEGLAQVALYTRVQNRRAQAFFGKMGFEQVASEGEGESAALIYVRSL